MEPAVVQRKEPAQPVVTDISGQSAVVWRSCLSLLHARAPLHANVMRMYSAQQRTRAAESRLDQDEDQRLAIRDPERLVILK